MTNFGIAFKGWSVNHALTDGGGALSPIDYSVTRTWGKYARNVHKLEEKNIFIFPGGLVCYGVPKNAITPILDGGRGLSGTLKVFM